MKHCNKCGAQKADTDFYASDKTCKECRKAAVRANYARNRDSYREYERRRSNSPQRVEARARYQSSEKGKERARAAKAAYAKRNPDIRAAQIALDNAVRDKRVWKSPCCMAPGCFSTERIHGHHVDYSRPLSVVWLCNACHKRVHREHTDRAAAA